MIVYARGAQPLVNGPDLTYHPVIIIQGVDSPAVQSFGSRGVVAVLIAVPTLPNFWNPRESHVPLCMRLLQ